MSLGFNHGTEDYCIPGGTYRENTYEMPGQAEPLPDHVAASMIWRAPAKQEPQMLNGVNGYANGHMEKDNQATVDPVALQLS